jgi:radical SAM protein with 4Fe4S-binding SPASM domain
MPSLYLADNKNKSLSVPVEKKDDLNNFINNSLRRKLSIPISFNKDLQNINEKKSLLATNNDLAWKCSANISSLFILPDGNVSLCEQLYWHPQFIIGNITEQTIKDIWQSDKAKRLLCFPKNANTRQSSCSKCKLKENCFEEQKRCWVNVIKANGYYNWLSADPECINQN